MDDFLLANSRCPIHSLNILLRIPRSVENDNVLRRLQVDPHASSGSGQDKYVDSLAEVVKIIYLRLSVYL